MLKQAGCRPWLDEDEMHGGTLLQPGLQHGPFCALATLRSRMTQAKECVCATTDINEQMASGIETAGCIVVRSSPPHARARKRRASTVMEEPTARRRCL